ncbi:MAG: HPr(Ser) kinase/phosphatase [Myxococcota bacterium]|nr:HPr(Ser) kinase/phosphatase [Myxococcota bacterium]
MRDVTIGQLMSVLGERSQFSVLAGGLRGLERTVTNAKVQRVGIALTGYLENVVSERIQLIGRSEMGYMDTLSTEVRKQTLSAFMAIGCPAVVVTADREPHAELVKLCEQDGVSLICTPLESTMAVTRLNHCLKTWLAPREVRHAVLVDVHGVGILLVGKSGIGKSEIGLELISRGHRLVADDMVILDQTSESAVVGHSPSLTQNHMEIRGLGIINIKDLYGVAAVRERKRVELVVELVEWSEMPTIDRLGLSIREMTLADVPVRHITLPVRPGRSLSLIIEVAARNRLLQHQGTHSAEAFAEQLRLHIARDSDPLTQTPFATGDDENE